ncbi:MAG: type III-A CRISPR-associated RAMP protein Csm3 [Polyangiaceae bacterium]|nr:type III-A CRISPR-associated RAMP protein Csm3 [Polyangiaceae bacterium]
MSDKTESQSGSSAEKLPEWGLRERITLKGTITALTGLRIGGTDQGLTVGGIQNILVRHALLNEPYIPGSSLKGKLRCLLERIYGIAGKPHGEMIQFGPAHDPECSVVQLFGNAADGNAAIPSRLIVRDARLSEPSRKQLSTLRGELRMSEVKTEVCIDRVTSAANPRTMERVPAGAEFEFEIVLEVRAVPSSAPKEPTAPARKDESLLEKTLKAQNNRRTKDNDWGRNDDLKLLLIALDLLQDDALGGQGSRGYGRVNLALTKIEFRNRDSYLKNNLKKDEDPLHLKIDDENAFKEAFGDKDGPDLWQRIQWFNKRGGDQKEALQKSLAQLGAT